MGAGAWLVGACAVKRGAGAGLRGLGAQGGGASGGGKGASLVLRVGAQARRWSGGGGWTRTRGGGGGKRGEERLGCYEKLETQKRSERNEGGGRGRYARNAGGVSEARLAPATR